VFPVSLLKAMNAGDDEEKWSESGAAAFTSALFDIIHRLIDAGFPEPGDEEAPPIRPDPADATEVGQSLIARSFEQMSAVRAIPVVKVLPRRVAAGERLLRTERPTADTGPTIVSYSDDDMFAAAAQMTANRTSGQ
jgi:hypothetical protein